MYGFESMGHSVAAQSENQSTMVKVSDLNKWFENEHVLNRLLKNHPKKRPDSLPMAPGHCVCCAS